MLRPFGILGYVFITGWAVAAVSGSENVHDLPESQDDVEIWGHPVCDLDAGYLATSGQNLLPQLAQCPFFAPDQIKAIQDLLMSGNTPFGPPSTWSSSTLDALSGLMPRLGRTILQSIPKRVLMPWLQHAFRTSQLPREDLRSLIKTLQPSRQKREAAEDCPPDRVITKKVMEDRLLPIRYTPTELDACMGYDVFMDNFALATSHAYTDRQMFVLKSKLDQGFPYGYPDYIIRNLGVLLEIMGEEDIKKWNMTSPETLAAVLEEQPDPNLASLIIRQYFDRGNPFNAAALNAIGPKYVCTLNKEQLSLINEQAIKAARPLDLSECPQATVDSLYPKAKRAFSDRHNEFPAYYNLIKPYLRGAPAQDLKALSKSPVEMDIGTFMSLKNGTIMQLTPGEVKGLLGPNVEELKNYQSEFPLVDWIPKQRQADLDELGIYKGGLPNGYINLARVPNRKKRRVA